MAKKFVLKGISFQVLDFNALHPSTWDYGIIKYNRLLYINYSVKKKLYNVYYRLKDFLKIGVKVVSLLKNLPYCLDVYTMGVNRI